MDENLQSFEEMSQLQYKSGEGRGEEIYVNLPVRRSHTVQESPSGQKPDLIPWAVASLVVLCVLLLVVNIVLGVKFSSEINELHGQICNLAVIAWKQYAVNITLDPNTAHSKLQLSADGKTVKLGNIQQNVIHSRKFGNVNSVLAKQGFTAGRFYYEVQVSGKKKWTIGLVRESFNRNNTVFRCPEYGVWAICLKDGNKYLTHGPRDIMVPESERPERVGVFVDYEAGLVSFYDADRWTILWTLKGVPFKEKIYPYFLTGFDYSPMIISDPVLCKK